MCGGFLIGASLRYLVSLDLLAQASGNVHAKGKWRMKSNLAEEIRNLSTLRRAALLAIWREFFSKSAHPKLRRDLMIPILAYRMQEKFYGGLSLANC